MRARTGRGQHQLQESDHHEEPESRSTEAPPMRQSGLDYAQWLRRQGDAAPGQAPALKVLDVDEDEAPFPFI